MYGTDVITSFGYDPIVLGHIDGEKLVETKVQTWMYQSSVLISPRWRGRSLTDISDDLPSIAALSRVVVMVGKGGGTTLVLTGESASSTMDALFTRTQSTDGSMLPDVPTGALVGDNSDTQTGTDIEDEDVEMRQVEALTWLAIPRKSLPVALAAPINIASLPRRKPSVFLTHDPGWDEDDNDG